MKIEKLNENRIKITFNHKDLEENHVSIHSFMSNSLENQSLFLRLLEIAEKEVGFITENYKIAIETLTQNNDDFTLIISRFYEKPKSLEKPRLHTSRKTYSLENTISLFKFQNFESFLSFSKDFSHNLPELEYVFTNKNSLYEYNNKYYLAIDRLNLNKKFLFKLTSYFSEFSDFVYISELTFQKLKEFGNCIIEKNAINICISD